MDKEVLIDQVFIKKLSTILEDNYSEDQFGVNELAIRMGISHSQLHRKLNSLYKKSTSQYIREYRLQQAMKMLQDDVVTASEISYRVGFSSPTYFSTSFKKYFGYPPGEVKYREIISIEEGDGLDNNDSIPSSLENYKTKHKGRSLSKNTIFALSVAGIVLIFAMFFFFYTISSEETVLSESKITKKSIAVLPFKDMSPDDTQWFCDGITEDILTYLSQINGLTVISRTSSDTYKNSGKKIPEIAKELGVSYIVEGSVRKHNDTVIITAQLIMSNDEHLWAAKYDENLADVFKIQQNVAKKIVNQLQIAISPEEEKTLNTTPTENLEAYELFLRGRAFAEKGTKEDFDQSIDFYNQAIQLDPSFADAYAEMATVYLFYTNMTNMYQYLDKSRQLVDEAISINPNSAKAYSAKGMLSIYENKSEESIKYLKKALELNPNDADAQRGMALYYSHGRNDDQDVAIFYSQIKKEDLESSLHHINKAEELDPFSLNVSQLKIDILLKNGKLIEAEEFYQKKISLFSDQNKIDIQNDFIINKARILSIEKKDWTEAIKYLHKEIELDTNNAFIYRVLGNFYNRILNDDVNFINYTQKAVELDPNNPHNVKFYFIALVEGEKFSEAEMLLNNVKDFISKEMYLEGLRYLYYTKGDLDAALELFSDPMMKDHYTSKVEVLARLGDIEGVREILNNNFLPHYRKAPVYASLMKKDSMYYNMNKEKNLNDIQFMNSLHEFDPYRKEERYKDFLRKNYLPITHWNE